MSVTEYSDYAKDRSGWFFGLSGLQLALVVFTGLPELAALNSRSWLLVLGWLPIWGLLVTLTVVPVRGRSAAQWLSAITSHALGGLMGWTRWQSKVAAGTVTDVDEADLPGVLAAVQIHDGPPFGHTMTRVAVIQDHAARTWAAVARIEHPGIGMAEADERDRMAAGLAELQEIVSRTELIELFAIQVRTVPDDGAERADWVRRHRKATAPQLARDVNDTLALHLMPAAVRNEAFVTVVVSEERIARSAKEAGGGIDGRARVLYGAIGEVEARLRGSIGCTGVTWLDSPALAVVIRTGFAPGDRAALVAAQPRRAATTRTIATGLPMAAAGPSTAHTEMRHYSHDAWSSVTDTILLPDQGAILGALAPVFVPSAPGERRSRHRVLPRDVTVEGRQSHRPGRNVGDRGQRTPPPQRAHRTSPAAPRQRQGQQHRREAGQGPCARAALRRRDDHGAEHVADRRIRPPPGRLDPPRRVHSAAS